VNPYAVVSILSAVIGYLLGWRTATNHLRKRPSRGLGATEGRDA
jgi:hypothetical protein